MILPPKPLLIMHRMTRSGGICKANAGGNLLQSSGCPEICDVHIPSDPSGQFPLCRPRGALGAFGFIRVTYIHNGSTSIPCCSARRTVAAVPLGGAVVDGDEQLRAAEHFVVAPEHAAGAIVILQHLNLIAGGEQSPIARAGRSIPSVRLRRAWDERTQPRVLRAHLPLRPGRPRQNTGRSRGPYRTRRYESPGHRPPAPCGAGAS